MEKKEENLRVHMCNKDDYIGSCGESNHYGCLVIYYYLSSPRHTVYFHMMEAYDSRILGGLCTRNDFMYKLGGLYYDYIKAMEGIVEVWDSVNRFNEWKQKNLA